MRVLVFLNPTNKHGTKMEYTELRKFLKKDKYTVFQPKVFMRVVTNRKGAEKHFRRIRDYAPKTRVIRILKLTEKQYENIEYLVGEENKQGKLVGKNCLIMI